MYSRSSRVALCCLALWAAPTRASAQAASQTPPSQDFLLSLMRFGVECRRAALPRNRYLGDDVRFAVSVERPAGGRASAPAAAEVLDGEATGPAAAASAAVRTTYRGLYRDLVEPTARESAVLFQCRADVKCIAAYRGKAVERLPRLRLATCSPRTASLVVGAARAFIDGRHETASGLK